jgi:hypothetical protein
MKLEMSSRNRASHSADAASGSSDCRRGRASYRFFEFLTANIRNPHTRRAYARAAHEFFDWLVDSSPLRPSSGRQHAFLFLAR